MLKTKAARQCSVESIDGKLDLYCEVHGCRIILGPYRPIFRQPGSCFNYSHYAYVVRGGQLLYMQYRVDAKLWKIARAIGDYDTPIRNPGKYVLLAHEGKLKFRSGTWFQAEEIQFMFGASPLDLGLKARRRVVDETSGATEDEDESIIEYFVPSNYEGVPTKTG